MNQSLENFYDAQIANVIIKFDDSEFETPYDSSSLIESKIEFPKPGLTFLLGKNGSGKSKLMSGIASLAGSKKNNFPEINLEFTWPSKSTLEEWAKIAEKSFVQCLDKDLELFKMGFDLRTSDGEIYEPNYPVLPLIQSILAGIMNYQNTFPPPFEDFTCIEILEYFEFDSHLINKWNSTSEQRKNVNANSDSTDKYTLTEPTFLQDVSIGEYALDLFLNILSQSNLDPIYSTFYPIGIFSSKVWMNNPENLKIFAEAFVEHVSSISGFTLEKKYMVSENISPIHQHWNAKLLSKTSGSNLMKKYEQMYFQCQETGASESSEHYKIDFEPSEIVLGFPFSLITPKTSNSQITFTSPAITTSRINQNFRHDTTGKLIQIDQIDFSENRGVLEGITQKLLSIFSISRDLDRLSITISGFDEIEILVNSLKEMVFELDPSISDIRIKNSLKELSKDDFDYSLSVFEMSQLILNSLSNPFILEFEFQVCASEKWIDLKNLSLGQQDIVWIFLHILSSCISKSEFKYKILLIDEFDMHLHPDISESLLNSINRIAEKNGISLLVSTHHAPLFKSNALRNRPKIFARRVPESTCFAYSNEVSSNQFQLPDILGTDVIDSLRFKELIIVVEGPYDQLVIEKFIYQTDPSLFERLHIIPASGTTGFRAVWNSLLSSISNNVLFIYDKQNAEIEDIWLDVKSRAIQYKNFRYFERLSPILRNLKNTKPLSPGDYESLGILKLLEVICYSSSANEDINRIHLHGVIYDDILDCLPFSHFSDKALPDIKSWEIAHQKFPKGEVLKKSLKISIGKVSNVLKKIQLHDVELKRLHSKILFLLDSDSST